MSVNIKPFIIINGTNSNDITGLMITKLPPISKPAMRVEAEEIDGRDGDIVTELGYSAYDKEIEIGLVGDYDVNDVIAFFNTSGQVVFSNEPDFFYRFAIYNAIDFEKLIRFKTATVTFHVQPFKFDVVSNDAVYFSPSNVTVTNEGNIYSRPEMAIQGSGNVGISVNGSDVLEINLGETQQAIIIDSDGMNAYGTKSNINELIVDINPVQSGSGDASPENIRPISGWSECNVYNVGGTLTTISEVNEKAYLQKIIDFGQTVYGGTLNVTTGVLTIDKKMVNAKDFNNWAKSGSVFYRNFSDVYMTNTEQYPTGRKPLMCSHFEYQSSSSISDCAIGYGGANYNNGNITIRYDALSTIEDWNTYIANNDVLIVYPLADAYIITVQLTAQEIQALIGKNNIWADTGAINELIYTKDGVEIETSGDIVSFDVDVIDIKDNILKNRLVTGNYDGLRLKAGNNQIGVSGDVYVMVLSNFSRWL